MIPKASEYMAQFRVMRGPCLVVQGRLTRGRPELREFTTDINGRSYWRFLRVL